MSISLLHFGNEFRNPPSSDLRAGCRPAVSGIDFKNSRIVGPQGRINKPAKSGDLFYSEPIAVIYLFESLFPRLIRTQIYSRIQPTSDMYPANRARECLCDGSRRGGNKCPAQRPKNSTTALLPIRSLTCRCRTTEGKLFEAPASPLIYSPKSRIYFIHYAALVDHLGAE